MEWTGNDLTSDKESVGRGFGLHQNTIHRRVLSEMQQDSSSLQPRGDASRSQFTYSRCIVHIGDAKHIHSVHTGRCRDCRTPPPQANTVQPELDSPATGGGAKLNNDEYPHVRRLMDFDFNLT